jgi:hypothetical protein
MPSISKSKRRGRGVGRVPFDEGKGGGTSGTLFPLPPIMGGRLAVTACCTVVPAEGGGSSDREVGDDPRTGYVGPKGHELGWLQVKTKENNVGFFKGFRRNREGYGKNPFEFSQDFWV